MRSPLALLAAGVVMLTTAGCGATTTVGSDGTLRLALGEYRVTPQAVQAAPGTLTIVVHNYGRLSHDLVITLDGVAEAATKPIAPGQRTELEATLPAGRYLMASSLLSDQALGAYGTLNVGSITEQEPGVRRRSYPHPGAGCVTLARSQQRDRPPTAATRGAGAGGPTPPVSRRRFALRRARYRNRR